MWRKFFTWTSLAFWLVLPRSAVAQEVQAPREDIPQLLRQLSSRIDALEAQHEADRRRIAELEKKLELLEQPAKNSDRALEIEEIAQAVRSELGESTPSTGLLGMSASAFGAGNEMNPQITLFVDGGGSVSSRGTNNALNRFNLREVELDFRAAISPSADGVVIVTLEEDVAQNFSGDVDIDRNVDIEEGYINFHSLPHDLSLRIGKMRNSFGVNNVLHTHDLPQVDRPLAVRSFLGPEGLITTGASLSWLVPNPWDKYMEATLQVVNSNGGTESPILGGPNSDNPAVVAHVKFFDDLTETSSIEVGGSYLYGSTAVDSAFDANLFGFDLTYSWVDPDPSQFHSVIVQAELFWAGNDIERGFALSERNSSFGAYVFGQYQINRDWYTGLRADYTEFPDSESRGRGDSDVALSPYLTWYISEFLRARLEYQHRWFDIDRGSGDEDALFLQITGVIGAHPPHPYWVHR